MQLFLKGDRCYTEKCAIQKRQYPPGMHGQGFRPRPSEYNNQLREKQKVKRIYGMLEGQFRRFFKEAARRPGITGENLLVLLEKRLDNVVYRMGLAASRSQARQLVSHGHILLNDQTCTIPSCLVKVGDEITLRKKSISLSLVTQSLESAKRKGEVHWIEIDAAKRRGKITAEPSREYLTLPMNEQQIVELYSR